MNALNNFIHYIPALFVLGVVMCRILRMNSRKTKLHVFVLYFGLGLATAYSLTLPTTPALVLSLSFVFIILLVSARSWANKQPAYTERKERS